MTIIANGKLKKIDLLSYAELFQAFVPNMHITIYFSSSSYIFGVNNFES